MNLAAQGVATGPDFSDMAAVRRVVERCDQLPAHPRHPYAGDAVMRAKHVERHGVLAQELIAADIRAADRREWSGVDEESVAA